MPNINIRNSTEYEVELSIHKLKNKKTYNPDGFPSFLMRNVVAVLSHPLATTIFNLSLKLNISPDQ